MLREKLFVTGGAGFIGSHFIREALRRNHAVLNLDAITYAANKTALDEFKQHKNYLFFKGHIEDEGFVYHLVKNFEPTAIINFAAESHVDRSIENPLPFVKTNVEGVVNLLQQAYRYYIKSSQDVKEKFRFLQISTDEVYGSVKKDPFIEEAPFNPSSPYAASKAAADHFVQSFSKTYNMPTLITHCTNNYGPYQFPEKLIPYMLIAAMNKKPLPIYGSGAQRRNWLHVLDHVDALFFILENAPTRQRFNIAGVETPTNLEIVHMIRDIITPHKILDLTLFNKLIQHVDDRPGHDSHYALNDRKLKTLGWRPKWDLKQGLAETCEWYLHNQSWWQSILGNGYDLKRRGMENKVHVA